MAMQWQQTTESGIQILTLSGEFDLQSTRTFEPVLKKLLEAKCPKLLLDFGEIAFIDSSGIATLITYFRDAQDFDGHLALCNVRAPILNVFNLVSLGTFFAIHATRAEGVAALKQ